MGFCGCAAGLTPGVTDMSPRWGLKEGGDGGLLCLPIWHPYGVCREDGMSGVQSRRDGISVAQGETLGAVRTVCR